MSALIVNSLNLIGVYFEETPLDDWFYDDTYFFTPWIKAVGSLYPFIPASPNYVDYCGWLHRISIDHIYNDIWARAADVVSQRMISNSKLPLLMDI